MDSSLRKYRTSLPSFPKHLPVKEVVDKAFKYTGVFTGDIVKVKSEEEGRELHECGCFGDSSCFQKQFLNERFYECEGIDGGTSEKFIFGRSELDEDLSLFLEEAFFLHYALKVLRILDETGKDISTEEFLKHCLRKNPAFITHFVAYHYFRAKNWVVKQGINFGSDFLLYKMGPQYYHSQFTVKVRNSKDSSDDFPSKQFMGWYRISESSKKECLVIEVISPENGTNDDSMELIRKLFEFKVQILTFKRLNLWKGSRIIGRTSSNS